MKASGHTVYYFEAKVICTCGNTFTAGSTKPGDKGRNLCQVPPVFYGRDAVCRYFGASGEIPEKTDGDC